MAARKRVHPRAAELLGIVRLVGECREQWYDPALWRAHLLRGIHDVIRESVVALEQFRVDPASPAGASDATATLSHGWPDPRTQRAFHDSLSGSALDRGLPARVYEHVAVGMAREGKAEVLPLEVAGARDWHHSAFYERSFDPLRMENVHASFRLLPRIGCMHLLNINQRKGESPIQPWQKDLLALLHDAIAPLIGTALAVEGQVCAEGLSPRRREVLDLLLEGLSEKEVASRLDLRPVTIHQYVGDIYRHFRVCSRAELMACFIRRRPR